MSARLFRPDNPLLPNYKYVPIGYHGRASSIRVSGTRSAAPTASASPPPRRADLRPVAQRSITSWSSASGSGRAIALGEPIPIDDAAEHIAGFCLLNDWSARDIQGWEYQPLGPFLAKSFCTTISPWIVTPEALAPFRVAQPPRPDGDPAAAPLSARRSGSGARRARYRARGAAAHPGISGGRACRRTALGQQHATPVLDRRADRRSPQQQRLQSAARRSVRLGHDLGADTGRPRQPARDHRRRAPSARLGEGDAPVPAGRRRGDLPRPRAARRLCVDRIRRGAGTNYRGRRSSWRSANPIGQSPRPL